MAMAANWGSWFDRLRGTGEASVAIPLFDGALKPNSRLDEADVVLSAPGLTDLCAVASDEAVYAAAGSVLKRLDTRGACSDIFSATGEINAIAANQEWIALALEGAIELLDKRGVHKVTVEAIAGQPLTCITSLTFGRDGAHLYITRGAEARRAKEWKLDLLNRGRSGSVMQLNLSTLRGETIASGLGWPSGTAQRPDGSVLIVESWTHSLVALSGSSQKTVVLADLPGYPSRLCAAEQDGYWLTLLARRTQLIELVLREPKYRKRMVEEVPEKYWIAPTFRSGDEFLEPLQFGAVRQMGILKPWAPTNSYGAVIRLDDDLLPLFSFQSRAGGKYHGTTSALEQGRRIYVLSRGADCVVSLPAAEE